MEVSCVSHGSSTPLDRDDAASSNNDVVEWSFEENKMFENALAELNLDAEDLFEKLCCFVPGKTFEQIKQHYEALVEDVNNIELGYVPLPNYNDDLLESSGPISHHQKKKKKGARWTKEEHENFLAGLDKYGKGDWKSISRNCVLSKTPTQVASHAQKYYLKLEKSSKTTKASISASTSQDTTTAAVASPPNP